MQQRFLLAVLALLALTGVQGSRLLEDGEQSLQRSRSSAASLLTSTVYIMLRFQVSLCGDCAASAAFSSGPA